MVYISHHTFSFVGLFLSLGVTKGSHVLFLYHTSITALQIAGRWMDFVELRKINYKSTFFILFNIHFVIYVPLFV